MDCTEEETWHGLSSDGFLSIKKKYGGATED